MAAVSWKYAFALLDQIMSKTLKLNHASHIKGSFRSDGTNAVILGDNRVIWSSDGAQRESAIDYFMRKQDEWVSLPETQLAAAAYQLAEQKTAEVKRHLERLELALSFPLGTRCPGCSGLPG